MARQKVPPQNVQPLDGDGRWTADYYDLIKQLDGLDPLSNLGSTANSLLGNPTGVDGSTVSVPLGAGLSFSSGSLIGTSVGGGSGALTLGIGLTRVSQVLRVSLSTLTNSLGADVSLNNTANYFDGPSVAQGTSGVWWVSGAVTMYDTAGTTRFHCKLWDGTTVIASGAATSNGTGAVAISLSGIISSPAANLRISTKDAGSTNGRMAFNLTGESKDCTITAIRIA